MSITVECPSCGRPVRVKDDLAGKRVRCPDCGKPFLVEEPDEPVAVARRSRPEPAPALPAPRKRLGPLTYLGGCGVLCVLACGGCLGLIGWGMGQAGADLKAGDELYAAGKRDEAVAKYKSGYAAAGSRKGEVMKRIVEHELSRGDAQEAKKWVGQALAENIEVSYDSPAANGLLAQVRREREQAAAQAAAQGGAKKGVTRENYDRIRDGMSLAEVEALLGKGREESSSGNLRVLTWQAGVVNFRAISVSFEDDRVIGKAILD